MKVAMTQNSGFKSLKDLLSAEASASLVGIWGDSTFDSPLSYEGTFISASATVNHWKAAHRADPDYHAFTLSLGRSTSTFGVSGLYKL